MIRLTRLLVAAILLVQAACAAPPPPTDPIVIDGSSTLAPLTEAVVADFQKTHRNVPIKLASVGTAEGFTHFCRAELDILDANDEDDRVGQGPIEPSPLNVGRGVYRPFARPLFIYVNQARLTRPEVKLFVDTYVRRAGELALSAGAAPLTGTSYELVTQRLTKGMTGTMFRTAEDRGQAIDLLLNE